MRLAGKAVRRRYVVKSQYSIAAELASLGLAHDEFEQLQKDGPTPDVLASAKLLALLERTCWVELTRSVDPGHRVVGRSQYVRHRAPIPIGAVLAVDARCSSVNDTRIDWSVRAFVGSRLVATAWLTFEVVSLEWPGAMESVRGSTDQSSIALATQART
ncbi:thioesterase, FlK family [Amycolatopsis anabasis]|uniref:thioesterase, FlK family n=1 Tax=Amycolatopsis anabasis TaxID=1840409 RepID=UPI00131DB1E9|nr:hotdog domain-containing protein [Amycolatopsis anabasis]